MKAVLLGLVSVVFAGTAIANTAAPSSGFKVGYVDMNKALQTTDAGKAALASLQKDMAAKKAALEKQQTDLQAEGEQFEKKQAILNETARAAKLNELQKKAQEFQRVAQESQFELQKRERELTKPLLDEMKSIIAVMAKEKNYNLVLEENGGAVLYAESGSELTESLIKEFNTKNKGKTPPPSKKK